MHTRVCMSAWWCVCAYACVYECIVVCSVSVVCDYLLHEPKGCVTFKEVCGRMPCGCKGAWVCLC